MCSDENELIVWPEMACRGCLAEDQRLPQAPLPRCESGCLGPGKGLGGRVAMRPRRGSPAAAEGHEPPVPRGFQGLAQRSSEAGKPYLTQVRALQLHYGAGAAGLGDSGTDLEHCQVQLSPVPGLTAVGRQGDRHLMPGTCGGSEGIGQGSGCPAGLGAGGQALGPLHHPLQPLALPASLSPPLGAPAGRAQRPNACPASCLSCGLPPSVPSEEELPRAPPPPPAL